MNKQMKINIKKIGITVDNEPVYRLSIKNKFFDWIDRDSIYVYEKDKNELIQSVWDAVNDNEFNVPWTKMY